MMRARILAGVATFAVACALPTAASAQLGPCPTIQPAPCIIVDPTRAAQTIKELKDKKDQLTNVIQEVKELTSLNGILGQVGASGNDPILGFVKPVLTGEKVTVSQAANALDSALRSSQRTQAGRQEASAADKVRLRAAAGDGYATALALKARLAEFDAAYQDLFSRVQARNEATAGSTPVSQADQAKMCRAVGVDKFKTWQAGSASGTSGKAAENVEEDWKLNTAARVLVMNTFILRREADIALVQLRSMSSVTSFSGTSSAGRFERSEAGPAAPGAGAPQHNIELGKLMNTVGQLLALKSAADTVKSLLTGISGAQDTQKEYDALKAVRDKFDTDLRSLAEREARGKGVSPDQLIAVANQVMGRLDRTTWDDPSKLDSARKAANAAKAALDRLVPGDVSSGWDNLLQQRAEAYKQEGFFRSYAADAKVYEASGRQALADYNSSIGMDATNAAALQAKIAELEAQLATISAGLNSAPEDVRSIRDRVISSALAPVAVDETSGPPNQSAI